MAEVAFSFMSEIIGLLCEGPMTGRSRVEKVFANGLAKTWGVFYSYRMKRFSQVLVLGTFLLSGCASQSQKTLAGLDHTRPEYHSQDCTNLRNQVWIHQDVKNVKSVGSGAAVVFLGPFAVLPVLATNIGLSVADHVDANEVAKACGGVPRTDLETAGSVALENSLGLVTGGMAPSAK
jgi:ABC-type uncharacterized transport system permease subunit